MAAYPDSFPFEKRHLYTQEPTNEHSFRVVSYNILSERFTDSVKYPYCPTYAQDADYRKHLLIKEIRGYNGDLVCVQEVDSKLYHQDLQPRFTSQEMEGHVFKKGGKMEGQFMKGGKVADSLACFIKTSKFRIYESDGIILDEQLQTDPLFSDLFLKISENQKLKERIIARNAELQVLLLECVSETNRLVLVGNTHLHSHPDAAHIRLLQATICVQYLENKLKEYKRKWPEKSISVLFCGDFNSCPQFGVYQLMTVGSVPHTSEDWKSAPEEHVKGLSVSQNIGFTSACGTPDYTNYTASFNGCLDYIFFQNSLLRLESSVPLPSHQDVTKDTALPSVVFPSDHIALIATLAWK